MFRARFLARLSSFGLFGVSAALLVLLATFMACTSDTTTLLTQPITGVTVQATSLLAGHGCGTGSSQVFKYAVVVNGVDALTASNNGIPLSQKTYNVFQAANLYDCFSDGTFTNLQASNGLFAYHLEVYAFDQAAYVAAGGDQLVTLMGDLQQNKARQDLDIANGGTGATFAMTVANDLGILRGKQATYSTTCTAEQLGQVQTLAVCKPLSLGTDAGGSNPATITLALDAFASSDGSVLSCTKDYASVRVTPTISGAAGPTIATTECTASPLTIRMASTPASYSLDVTLVKADETVLGTTTCAADTSYNLTVPAKCTPVQ